MDTGWQIEGMDELARMFENLPDKIADNILKDAIKDAAKLVQRAAKANVTKQSGLLKKSMIVKTKTYGKSGSKTTLAIVGPSKNIEGQYEGKRRVPKNYAHLVEYGFYSKKAKRFIKPQAFMRPAYQANMQAMISVVKQAIQAKIDEVAKQAQQ